MSAEYVLRGDELRLAIEAMAPTAEDPALDILWRIRRDTLRRQLKAAWYEEMPDAS